MSNSKPAGQIVELRASHCLLLLLRTQPLIFTLFNPFPLSSPSQRTIAVIRTNSDCARTAILPPYLLNTWNDERSRLSHPNMSRKRNLLPPVFRPPRKETADHPPSTHTPPPMPAVNRGLGMLDSWIFDISL